MYTFIQIEIDIDRKYFWQFSRKRESSIDGVIVFYGASIQSYFFHAN